MARRKNVAAPAAPVAGATASELVDTMKYLLNPSTGRVLPASPRLLERSDLIPCSKDGVPLRPAAGRIASVAMRKREIEAARDAEYAALGQSAVVETKDTFGSPNNPVAVPAGDKAPVSDLEAGLDELGD